MNELTQYIHPLLFYLIFFIIGIKLGAIPAFSFFWLVPLLIIIIALLVKGQRQLIIFASCMLAGACSYQYRLNQFENFYQKYSGQKLTIMGTIIDANMRPTNPRWLYTIKTDTFINQNSENITKASARIHVYSMQKLKFKPGDRITIKDATFKKPTNESYANYLYKIGINSTLFINTTEQASLLWHPPYSIYRFLHEQKQRLSHQIRNQLSPITFSLFSSLFLGDKNCNKNIMTQLKTDFAQWGISHYLARSGLHVMIFVMLWGFLLRCIPIYIKIRYLFLLIALTIYALLTTSSLSFMRALLMFSCYSTYIFFDLPISMIHIITLITFGMLALNPFILFALDFQLSFGITFALLWFNQINFIHKKEMYNLATNT